MLAALLRFAPAFVMWYGVHKPMRRWDESNRTWARKRWEVRLYLLQHTNQYCTPRINRQMSFKRRRYG